MRNVFKTPDDPNYYTYPDGDLATIEEIVAFKMKEKAPKRD